MKTYILKHNISNLVSLVTDLNLLSSLYILLKYMTNTAHRNTTYKLKPKIILTCLLHSWIMYNDLFGLLRDLIRILDNKICENNIYVRHGSHWEWKSTRWTWRCVDLWNNIGFSLYTVLSLCCVITISDDREKSEMGVSADLVCYCWTLGIKFNKSLSSLIIRLANYSITTSLIYKFLL